MAPRKTKKQEAPNQLELCEAAPDEQPSMLDADLLSAAGGEEQKEREAHGVEPEGASGSEVEEAAGVAVDDEKQDEPAAADEPGTMAVADAPAVPAEPVLAGALPGRRLRLGNPSALDLALFCRQFATLIEVGVPGLEAFRTLARRTSNGRLRQALKVATREVEAGRRMHEAMAHQAGVFTPLMIDAVRAGETAGRLEDVLPRLAEIMERKARVASRSRAAILHPLIALGVAAGVLVSILVTAIPRFAAVYGSRESLPALTRLLIDLSDFFAGAWGVLLTCAAGLSVGLGWWFGYTPGGRRAWSWIALRLPLLGGVSCKIGVARSARTLSGMVGAGIPLAEALTITGDANENALIADAFRAARAAVEQGERMAGPLAKADVFPPQVIDMIATGEETGSLERMLAKVADAYDAEVESDLAGLTSIIEPLLIVLFGGVAVLIALAVLMPYFQLAGRIES